MAYTGPVPTHIPPLGTPELAELDAWTNRHRLTNRWCSLVWRLLRDYRAACADNQRLRDEIGRYVNTGRIRMAYQYTVRQVAEYVQLSRATISGMCASGAIKATRTTAGWRISQRALEEYLNTTPRHAARAEIPSTASASDTEDTGQTFPPVHDAAKSA